MDIRAVSQNYHERRKRKEPKGIPPCNSSNNRLKSQSGLGFEEALYLLDRAYGINERTFLSEKLFDIGCSS